MEYSLNQLKSWNQKIEELVKNAGLTIYPQEFELLSYEDMISYQAYNGMPAHYPHWSFGKAYERIKTFYSYNLIGLPYEMVINSNPCLAYLMKDNSLLLQILTMTHVYAHNDFFKNNRLFQEETKAEYTLEMFKNHAKRIRGYILDPDIQYKEVEKILNTAHALKLQTSRVIGEKRLSKEKLKENLKIGLIKKEEQFPLLEERTVSDIPDLNKIPLKAEEDILYFFIEYGNLEDWQRDILQIVVDETRYFIPQIETKIINEGWATFWHYRLLNQLNLPPNLHLEFLKRHNQLIQPLKGGLNPYYLGYMIFKDIEEKQGDLILQVRELERDASFIRKYLNFDLVRELNLLKFTEEERYYLISELADEEGWKKIRDTLASSVGLGKIPVIKVVDSCKKEHTLYLEHEDNGQELELNYAAETLKYIVNLWQGPVSLKTVIEDEEKILFCSSDKKISFRRT